MKIKEEEKKNNELKRKKNDLEFETAYCKLIVTLGSPGTIGEKSVA